MSLKNIHIALAGPQRTPSADLKKLIKKNGGTFSEDVTASCTHLLVTWDMASVIDNEYHLQWFPDFKPRVDRAQMLGIPLVDEEFIHTSIQQGHAVDVSPFLVLGKNTESFTLMTSSAQLVSNGVQSCLDPRVSALVEMIFDKNAMDKTLKDMSLDFTKFYLVTQDSIKAGYSVLSELEEAIQNASALQASSSNKPANVTKTNQEQEKWTSRIKELSDKFYTTIPHKHSGRPPNIDSEGLLKEKLAMLEALTDIEIASRLRQQKIDDADAASMHPTDINYRKLRTKMIPLEKSSKAYSIIEQYLQNTQAAQDAHTLSRFSLEIVDIFEVEREGETERFGKLYQNLPNHKLLWHGSRSTNFVGILSQGLRIAPPEAPVTGYYLGKGIYFADIVSKSAEYCRTSPDNPHGLLLLCDVALGRCFQVSYGKYLAKSDLDEAGFHSTKCCGEYAPAPGFDVDLEPGLVVPLGTETRAPVLSSELRHNEYVVYDVQQVHIKYLLKVKFNYMTEAQGPNASECKAS